MQIKKYSLCYGDRVLAQDFEVDFFNHVVNVLTGANGAGKTTLLDFIAGVGPKQAKGQKINVPKQQNIAYQLQHIHFFPTLSVGQTINMYRQIGNRSLEKSGSTFQTIKRQALDKIWSVKMGQLSGGERQMVLTYGQCLLEKELYIFDEPTSGVDVTNSKVILRMIASLVQEREKLVIMTSHNIEQLADLPVKMINIG